MRKLGIFLLLVVSYALLLISVEFGIFLPSWFSASFGFGCIICLLYFIQFLPEAIASTRWPTIDGEIIKSEGGKQKGIRYVSTYPIVVYSYSFNGQEYQSERIKVGAQGISSTDDNWVEGTLDKYPVGKSVNVRFNPKSPTKAVLEPGMNFRIFYGAFWV